LGVLIGFKYVELNKVISVEPKLLVFLKHGGFNIDGGYILKARSNAHQENQILIVKWRESVYLEPDNNLCNS